MRYLLIIILCCLFVNLSANLNYRRTARDRAGRREWSNHNYDAAERHFRENAIENPNVGQFHFNRGTALYRQQEFDEAQREFQRALNDRNFTDRDKVFHNMGNIAFHEGEFEDALELYRRALLENSYNADARTNWELTRRMIEMMADEQPQQDDNNDNNDDQDQQEQQQQQQQQDDNDLDREEAERMLQALERHQEQEREQETGQGVRRGRFW